MLVELRIRDFAIIEQLSLPLAPGFNVLSGETGAGKSIIVGALALLLGERASADLIRTGAQKAAVEGVFDVAGRRDLLALLDARGVETDGDTVILKREVAAGGRGRAWINGSPVTASVLAEIGRAMVDLHGQHEAQSLLDPDSQRGILDAYGDAKELAARVRGAHESLSGVTREIDALRARRADAERRADYLRHLVKEIENAKLVPGEEAQLEEEARRLEHADELRSLASGMVGALEGDDAAALTQLAHVQRSLAAIQRIDPTLARLQEQFDAGFYALQELARELDAYSAAVDLDPARLERVQARRDQLFRLLKKYGPSVDAALETLRTSRAELDLVDTADLDIRNLETRRDAARAELSAAAVALTATRREAAARLGREVDALLPDLGMPDGHLRAELIARAEPAATGAEDVEFRVALNVGHDARPLARVASGGELSRVMLALKTILARLDDVPTLVFDEVDAGIGGAVGLQVGDTMRRVAAAHQVLAITHLPQIAARAHNHIVVEKGHRAGITSADTRVASGEDRVAELARMLGGDSESALARAHAKELMESAAAASHGAPATHASRSAAKRSAR